MACIYLLKSSSPSKQLMIMQKKSVLLFPLLVLLLTACHSSKQPIGSTADIIAGSKTLYQFKWYLTTLQGQNITPNEHAIPYIIFKQGNPDKVSGNTGCNNL